MILDEATFRRLCRLARLAVEPAEAERLRSDLERIVSFVSRVASIAGEADAEQGVGKAPAPTPMRPDHPGSCCAAQDALDGAPETRDGFYLVPAVIRRERGDQTGAGAPRA